MLKKILLSCIIIFSFSTVSIGQCNPPTNVGLLNTYPDSILISWDAPIDSFLVETIPAGFTQGTGVVANVYDTVFTINKINGCFNQDIYIARVCNGVASAYSGPHRFYFVPTQVFLDSSSVDSFKISWGGPIGDYNITYGTQGFNPYSTIFNQSTGASATVINDSVATLKNYWGCSNLDFYISVSCNNFGTNFFGPFSLVLPTTHSPIYEIKNNFGNSFCGDSIFPISGGFRISFPYLFPNKFPTSFYHIPVKNNKFLHAEGIRDTVMRYFTPWVDFSGGTKDAVFYLYSNNETNPGDNVTLNVHVHNGAQTYSNVFTYSGDDPDWKKIFIDLSPYYSSQTNIVRLEFEVNQKTAINPDWNDFMLDHIYVVDTGTCLSSSPATFVRPTPTSISIKRTNFATNYYPTPRFTEYQWGPIGFTPNNGNFGQLKATTDSSYIAVPPNTNWLYIKDSCHYDLEYFSKWIGPFNIDSSYSHTLSGKVYIDLDSNCVIDTAATHHPHQSSMQLFPEKTIIRINSNGEFQIDVWEGQHWIKPLKPEVKIACGIDSIHYDTDSLSTLTQNINLDHKWFLDNSNVFINGFQNYLLLQGATRFIDYSVKNNTPFETDSINVYIEIDTLVCTVDSAVNFVYDPINHWYHRKIPPIASYDNYRQNGAFTVVGKIDTALLGQLGINVYRIDSFIPIEAPKYGGAVNSTQRGYRSVSAYDPNDKQVFPFENTIRKDSILDYRIRFQNTGNFPASQVIVTDTLPMYLRNGEFDLIGTSHDCFTSLDSNGVLKFLFSDINLPDSTTDLEGSQGFIDFYVKLNAPMQIGDSVANKAYIYFDYQPPIITNYAWVKVIDSCDFILPEASFTSNFVSLNAQGYSMNFTSTAKNAKTVSWNFGDGTQDTGATVSHLYTSNSSFTVIQTIVNNCSIQDTSVQTFNIQGIGLDEFINGGLKMFPNPAKNNVKITCTSGEKINLKLLNVSGRTVLKEQMSGGKSNLDFSNIPSGSYVLQLRSLDGELIAQEKLQITK